jgi:hypothetical protein
VETSGYGPRLSALVGVLGGTYHLSHRKAAGLLDQLLGITISTGANGLRPTASTTPSAAASALLWPHR